jgi:HPr kinase/phosphorylase
MNDSAGAGEASPRFIHANALILRDCGVLLRGAPGTGKSTLTLDLIDYARTRGAFARLVGDDRVQLMLSNGRVIATPHPAIRGDIEIRGIGVVKAPFEPAGVIRLVVDLFTAPEPARHPDRPLRMQICGVDLPWLPIRSGDPAAGRKIYSFFHALVA